MRATLPAIEFLRTDNYLQLAQVIQGSLMFIGNQSSPYAVAEGLKVRRVLEVFSKLPNVMPEGLHGYEAWMQPQFEQAVRRCLDA
jgi:hypothetical protein